MGVPPSRLQAPLSGHLPGPPPTTGVRWTDHVGLRTVIRRVGRGLPLVEIEAGVPPQVPGRSPDARTGADYTPLPAVGADVADRGFVCAHETLPPQWVRRKSLVQEDDQARTSILHRPQTERTYRLYDVFNTQLDGVPGSSPDTGERVSARDSR